MRQPRKVEPSPTNLSRRDFVRRTAGLTAGVGALVWTAPAVHSVQVGNAPGSAAPSTTTEAPTIEPNVGPETAGTPNGAATTTTTPKQPGTGPGGGGTGAAADPTGGGGGGGGLPLTGTNAARLAAAGATAVVGGRLLMNLRDRTMDSFGAPYDRPR